MELLFTGRVEVELDVDPEKFRGLTVAEIYAELQKALRQFALGVSVVEQELEHAAMKLAVVANRQRGECWAPVAVPEHIEEWMDA